MPTCATAGVSAVGFFQSLPPIFIFLASAASLVSTSPGAVAWHEDRNMTLRYSRKKRHTLIKLHLPPERWSFDFIHSWPKRDKKSSPPWRGGQFDLRQRRASSRYRAADLQVFDMCFMLFTSRTPCWAAPVEELAALEPDVLPVICTSCPTWSLSSAVLPMS